MKWMKRAAFLLLVVVCAFCTGGDDDPVERTPIVKAQGGLGFAYVDVASEMGYTMPNRSGKDREKEYILAAMPPGIAVADFDGDGWFDLYCPNGNRIVSYDPKTEVITFLSGADAPRNELFFNRGGKRFEARGRAAGVDDPGWAFGAIAGDIDNDGDPDLFVCNWGVNRLYLNDGTGRFREVGASAGVAGNPRHWSLGACLFDYDNDGDLDLYVAQYADMDDMLRDPTITTYLPDGGIFARKCKWRKLDVYCGPTGLRPLNDVLLKNLLVETGELKFRDVTKEAGCWLKYDPKRSETTESSGPYYGFQPVAFDIDLDGWQDIFVANDTQENLCWINQKDGTFKNKALTMGLARSMDDFSTQASMGVAVADFNQDGMLDITITEFSHDEFNLLLGEKLPSGLVVFNEVAARTIVRDATFLALGWGALFFDPDLDGDFDIFYACGHVFPEVAGVKGIDTTYKQANILLLSEDPQSLLLRKVGGIAGPGLALERCSRGAVLIDFDNDGDPDIATTELNDRPALLRCDNGSGRRWLSVRLRGNPARRVPMDPAGAVVTVKTGDRTQMRPFLIGSSFLSSEDPRLLFGMGAHKTFDFVEVAWPNGETTRLPGSHTNQALTISLK